MGAGMGPYQRGMGLQEAAERIGPIAGLDPGKIEGFVILIVGTDNSANSIAASENISPHMAAHLLEATAAVLFTAEAEADRRRGQN